MNTMPKLPTPAKTISFADLLRENGNETVTVPVSLLAELLAEKAPAPKKKSHKACKTLSPIKANGQKKATAAEPIRSAEDFNRVAAYIKETGRHSIRNYALFICGTTLGLRIGDLLRVNLYDVYDPATGFVRDYVMMIEEKTGKRSRNLITESAKAALTEYIGTLETAVDCPLFMSQKPDADGNPRPMDKSMAWRILNGAAKACGLKEHVSTHSMRKTYGYSANARMTEADVPASVIMETLQAKFRHDSQTTTMRYIGLQQDQIDAVASAVDGWIGG